MAFDIVTGFTERAGGVSGKAYESLNLAFHVGDSVQNVVQNRKILAKNLGVNFSDLMFMNQIHGDEIFVIDEDFLAKFKDDLARNFDDIGAKFSQIYPTCDAMITHLKGVALCVMVADCSPVLIIDENRGAIAAIHAGRAGVMSKICTKTVLKMSQIYGSHPRDLRAIVGANIKGGCYEVGELNLGEFTRYKTQGKFDMNAALRDEFSQLGIKNVKFDPACTHCEDRYFSYRRDGVSGRFAGYAMIKADKNGL